MDTKERLEHASEVLGWLAEGKEIQGKHAVARDVWEDLGTPNTPGIVELILGGTYIYRIKPAPVEWCERIVAANAATGLAVYLPEEIFKVGMRVKVTVLES